MRRLRAVLGTLVLLAMAGSLLALAPRAASAGPATPAVAAATTVTVSASRSAAGSHPDRLRRERSGRQPVWRSAGAPVGTVLTTRFSRPTRIDGMRIQGAGATLRIREARVEFGNGSALAVTTDGEGDRRIVFPSRVVRGVRLIVTGVAAGQPQVGLVAWRLRTGSAGSAARVPGDAVRSARLDASSGVASRQGWTSGAAGGGQWLRARWDRPMEVSAVRLSGGGAAGASVRTGYLRFSDGSRVITGALEPRGGAPTTVAFTPRMTTSVRFVATDVPQGVHASVRRLAAYTVGALPSDPALRTPTFRSVVPRARACPDVPASPSHRLALLCPSNGSRVGATARLLVAGPPGARLVVVASRPGAGSAVQRVAVARVGAGGTAGLSIPMRTLVHGPTAMRITATGVADPLYVQLENPVGVRERRTTGEAARGMDLKLDEEFDSPLSATRSGAAAAYASGKPNSYGVDDFGDAIFAQPTADEHNLGTRDGVLRIRTRALSRAEVDPAGYGRRSIGGLISSAHLGGSGFSAQHGYFEARMLGPAGTGTWPAFWLLSTGSLTRAGAGTGEVDAVELYGHDPAGRCQTVHSWSTHADPTGRAYCGSFRGAGDFALAWHTYGAQVTPTGTVFTVDGRVTARAPAVVGRDEPFFFLVDLALGGGWPVDLGATGSEVTLYVDSVRVWV